MVRFLPMIPLLVGVACDGGEDGVDDGPTGPLSSCDGVDPSVCAYPFPSSHFLEEDPTAPSGWRVAFRGDSLPLNYDGVRTLPDFWNERDGFSINSPGIVFLDGATLDGTVPVDDIGRFEDADAKTVIVDVAAGARHPHWVELDDTAPGPEERVTLLRPAVPYDWSSHYVVGIRGVVDETGAPVAPSPMFAALRDGTELDDPELAADLALRRPYYEEVIFPALEAQGFARSELQVAWDFRTASRENTLGDLEHIRDDALGWVEEQGGFDYTFTRVRRDTDLDDDRLDCSREDANIALQIEGELTVPLYLVSPDPEIPGDDELQAVFVRGDDGKPARNGTTTAGFVIRVPCSVAYGADGEGPVAASAPVVQYGHGLLGDKAEAADYDLWKGPDEERGIFSEGPGDDGYLAKLANERGFVILGMSWTGFADDDAIPITFMLAAADPDTLNTSDFAIVPQRSSQGMVEFALGMRMMITDMVSDPELVFDGVEVIDPARPYYVGNSQGAIMGTAYMGMAPDVTRGVLGVGGGPYSLLLPRSKDFDDFFLLLRNKYEDHRVTMLFVAGLTQQLWDPIEPGGWMWDLGRDTGKDVLLQVAIYDNQVTTLGAHIQARAFDAFVPEPAVRVPWGLEAVDVGDGRAGSALVEFRYTDLPDEPTGVIPPGRDDLVEGTEYDDGRRLDPHECPRREPEGQEQLWHFLETGEVIQTCGPDGCVGEVRGTCG